MGRSIGGPLVPGPRVRGMGSTGVSLSSPPVNTVAPVASGTVTIGGTLTITPGTYTGAPAPTKTYQWYRGNLIDGVGSYVAIGGETGLTHAPVAADMGYSIVCDETATNAAGSVTVRSNALRYDPKTLYRSVYDPKSAGGFIDDVGTSAANDLTARGNPTSSASDANFNNEPTVTADGTGDYWDIATASMGGAMTAISVFMVVRINSASAGDGWWNYVVAGCDLRLRQIAGPLSQITGVGTGVVASSSTTNIAGTKLIGANIAINGSQSVYYKTTAEDTDTNTIASLADSGSLTIGALAGGVGDGSATYGLVIVHRAVLAAGALADLGAYCTNRFGAGVGT